MKEIIVHGAYGIYAKVLAHSVGPDGTNLITFEISYPRIVLAEENTHRMLSKNSASSRAIPFEKMVQNLTGRPVRFGQANAGMQDKGEDFDGRVAIPGVEADSRAGGPVYLSPEDAWAAAIESATEWSRAFFEAGYHKQVYNRLTEAGQMMKTVISGTELANFYWLRDDGAADPTLRELARVMHEAQRLSTPLYLNAGDWHLPYVRCVRNSGGTMTYMILQSGDPDGDEYCGWTPLSLENARKVSAARCAAVSFRNVDYTLEKSLVVYERLVGEDRKHASAFEHQATPMAVARYGPLPTGADLREAVNITAYPQTWEEGVSHADRKGQLWSGNFRQWIQFRKLIPGENYPGFDTE